MPKDPIDWNAIDITNALNSKKDYKDRPTRDNWSMEEVCTLVADMVDLAENKFKEKGGALSIKESDSIFNPLLEILEKLADYPDYSNYN